MLYRNVLSEPNDLHFVVFQVCVIVRKNWLNQGVSFNKFSLHRDFPPAAVQVFGHQFSRCPRILFIPENKIFTSKVFISLFTFKEHKSFTQGSAIHFFGFGGISLQLERENKTMSQVLLFERYCISRLY